MHLNICRANTSIASADTESISTCVDQTYPMPAKTQNESQKSLNLSHFCEDTKCVSTCVSKTHSMPAKKQNATQHVLTKPIQFKTRHKMHFILC